MRKAILATFVVLFALLAVMSLVNAEEGLTNSFGVTIDGIEYSACDTIGIEAGETIPIKVIFTAAETVEDVRVQVWIDGYRRDIVDKTGRFELVEGSKYSKLFSLTVPSDIDPTEDYSLIVRVSSKTKNHEEEFPLRLQRESYKGDVLSVDTDSQITAGSTIGVDVVLKNRGMHELEDVFVTANIADLGVQKKVYFGDLVAEDDDQDDEKDATERRLYLTIPKNAKSGTYVLEVEASNSDFSEKVKKSIVITGQESASEVLSGLTAKAIAVGQEATYDLVIVNSGEEIKVYTLTPEDAEGLIVEVDPIVTVSGDSSKTVKVTVRATDSAKEGTHTIAVNVESNGELVKRAVFSANVEKQTAAGSIVVLTIILAIVFLVLLVILIVLLTRKQAAMPESDETSYY